MFAKVRGDLADGVGGGDVERQGCTADPVRRVSGKGFGGLLDIDRHDGRPVAGGILGDGGADAPGGARDDPDLASRWLVPVGGGVESAAPTENTWPST